MNESPRHFSVSRSFGERGNTHFHSSSILGRWCWITAGPTIFEMGHFLVQVRASYDERGPQPHQPPGGGEGEAHSSLFLICTDLLTAGQKQSRTGAASSAGATKRRGSGPSPSPPEPFRAATATHKWRLPHQMAPPAHCKPGTSKPPPTKY